MAVVVKCKQCEKEFELHPGDIKRGRGKYCSIECYHNSTAPTSIEEAIEHELKKLNIPYEAQKVVGNWPGPVDFFLPKHNIIIEADGDYWHRSEEAIQRDFRKNQIHRRNGYHVLRIPEHEIRIDPKEALVSRLSPFLKREGS